PFVKMFPVGLGLKMMGASTLLTTLMFFMVLPVFGQLKGKGRLAFLFLILFFVFGIASHIQSEFIPERPKPSRLLYIYNAVVESAVCASYDRQRNGLNGQVLGEVRRPATDRGLVSKDRALLSFMAEAHKKDIPLPDIESLRDTVV